jgi:HlyD family secretion protein
MSNSGETIAVGSRLFEICQMTKLRIEGEVDEFDLPHIGIGAKVLIRAEGRQEAWAGHVTEIPAQVVGRKLKPQDPARPSDTRVLLVKIAIDGAAPLKLGQRVELEWAS